MIIGITGTLGAGKGTTLRAVFGIRYSGATLTDIKEKQVGARCSLVGRMTLSSDLSNWRKFDFNSVGDLL